MQSVEVSHVAKSFGETRAVIDVSFGVERATGIAPPDHSVPTSVMRAPRGNPQPTGTP